MAEFMAGKWQKNDKAGADDKRNYNVLCLYRPKLGWRQSRPEAICGRFGAAFCWQNEAEGGKRMTKDLKKQHQWGKISLQMQRRLQTAAIVCYMVVMFVQPAAAASTTDTIWTRFSTIMSDIYGELLGISTIVAVTAAAIALLVRMISRNERAVAEATSWLKRIVVTWIVLNTLGFIVAYLQPLIQGGQYTPTS